MEQCGFAGNADVYGIGIRIGYYTQALAAWYASFFHFREAQILRDVNKLFLFALVVVGLIYSANARETYAVEAFLLLQIGMVIGLISIMDTSRYSSRYTRTSNERLVSRIAIMGAGLLFNICFWWRGLDVMQETPCNRLNMASKERRSTQDTKGATYVCFFAKVGMYGWVRTLMRVMTLYGAITSILTVGFRDAVELLQAWRGRKVKDAFKAAAKAYGKSTGEGQCILGLSEGAGPHAQSSEKPTKGQENLTGQLVASAPPPPGDEALRNDKRASTKKKEISQPGQSSHPSNDSLQVFCAVQDAEIFLDSVFSIYRDNNKSLNQKRFVQVFGGYINAYVPRSAYQESGMGSKYSKCLWSWFTMQWTRRPTVSQRWMISLHMQGLGQHNFWRVPRFYHRIRQLSATSEVPAWQMLAIASDVQLSQIPLTKSARVWAGMAIYKLILIVALIVQVELTLAWNNISGLQSITTVGQLIPFILGVGGLIKVLWGKWYLIRRGVKETHDMDGRPPGEYELAMKQYLQWKSALKEFPLPQPCTKRTEDRSEPKSTDSAATQHMNNTA